jgi:flavin reductase (DIM6/NTAB) family NADH-FMN oxidoreductase RutF
LFKRARKLVRQLMLGRHELPQQCILGMSDPQDEVAVELYGLSTPRDVTNRHTLACAAPFAVCVRLESGLEQRLREARRLSMHFRDRDSQRLLGELRLQFSGIVHFDDQEAYCFAVSRCRNYCLPQAQLWLRYLHGAYVRWRRPPYMRLASNDIRAMPIFFICPRPVGLVSVGAEVGNLFPMNLMGSLGERHFGFALNSTRTSASLVKRAGRLALSDVPLSQASLARDLGKNHRKEFIEWHDLPFNTRPSKKLGLPVPSFSLRVREMEVITAREMGSHTFFLAHILEDEYCADGLQFFMVHGIYQAWREKHRGDEQAFDNAPAL